MKVGMVTGSLSREAGGLFESVSSLARAVQAIPGASVAVFGLRNDYTESDISAWKEIENVTALRVLGPAAFGYAPGLLRELRAARLDVLHLHGIWMYPSVASLIWSWWANQPMVISPHGMLDPWAVANSRWKKWFAGVLYEHRNLRQAACLHALSESEARGIREYGLENPICIISNGVELPSIDVQTQVPWDGMISSDYKVLLYLGRLHPKKNLKSLLKAWSAVVETRAREDWCLVIVGPDEEGYEGTLKAYVDEDDLSHVWFTGPRYGEEKEACLAGADAFVLPSRSEGLPMAVLEAWAYCLPVLMTGECNLPQGFEAGAALRVRQDAESIADGIRRLASLSATERKAMGDRGRKLVESEYTWPQIGQQMLAVYRWVLGEGGEPASLVS